MDFESCKASVATARDHTRKPIARNTYAIKRAEDCYAIRFHQTDVVTFFEDGRVVLDAGGWRTMSTRDRMCYATGLRVLSEDGEWYVATLEREGDHWRYPRRRDPNVVPYFDGIMLQRQDDGTLRVTNGLSSEAFEERMREVKDTKRRIAKFLRAVRKQLQAGEVPMPSGGDCWLCCMRNVDTGEAMGDARGDNHDHLWSHMDEEYVVPSLLVNAMREKGYRDIGIYMLLDMHPEENRMGGKRGGDYALVIGALRRYLKSRLIPTDEGSTPAGARERHGMGRGH